MALVGIEMIAQWFLANRFEVPTSQPAHVNNQRLSSLVTLVAALSMITTSLLLLAQRRFWQPRVENDPGCDRCASRHAGTREAPGSGPFCSGAATRYL
jgi:hypothetical protein